MNVNLYKQQIIRIFTDSHRQLQHNLGQDRTYATRSPTSPSSFGLQNCIAEMVVSK